MLGYGLPRHLDTEQPDSNALLHYGLKSSKGRRDGKNTRHNTNSKRSMRRYWKKKERRQTKESIREYLN